MGRWPYAVEGTLAALLLGDALVLVHSALALAPGATTSRRRRRRRRKLGYQPPPPPPVRWEHALGWMVTSNAVVVLAVGAALLLALQLRVGGDGGGGAPSEAASLASAAARVVREWLVVALVPAGAVAGHRVLSGGRCG
eukprot:COSAG01_NODE_1447_length_10278_cov_47.625209_2_plen_139_part_00